MCIYTIASVGDTEPIYLVKIAGYKARMARFQPHAIAGLCPGDLRLRCSAVFSNRWNEKRGGPGCKPGYVAGERAPINSSVFPTAARHLSVRHVAMRAIAVYPPAMDEQPLNAGILDLATHKACGILYRYRTRWALTPPFHPYPHGGGRLFSVTLPLQLSHSFPLRNMVLYVARTFLKPFTMRVSDEPPGLP